MSYKFSLYISIVTILFASCGNKEAPIKPETKSMTEAVYASGEIIPAGNYKLYSLVDGVLMKKLVAEGDMITNGQTLFELDADVQEFRRANSQQSYNTASQNFGPLLDELSLQVQSAENRYRQDSLNFIRYDNLRKSDAIAMIEFDKAKLLLQNSRNEYLLLKKRYVRTKNQLSLELNNARTQLNINESDRSKYNIKALDGGKVYEIYKENGELIRRYEPVAMIGNSKQMEIKMMVEEEDISKIKIGQEVVIKIDGFADKVYKATVKSIYPSISKQEQAFRVDALLIDAPTNIYPGQSVEANIIINQKKDILCVPKNYIQGKDTVWVMKNNEKTAIKIEAGISDIEWVEILSGINKNDELVKPPKK
ncbi:MAG: HlyD family efflux transporter periplasmic adaptor subunit [Bacteroidota bacterium]|nr:HlyD family efflux transporter periplasmic adaptor subunit [Bacteroidota bacterium]